MDAVGESTPGLGGKQTAFWLCTAILVAIALVGTRFPPQSSEAAWLLVMVGLVAFAVIAGRSTTGLWLGILIDARGKISLSRLQMLAWSALILSAFLTAVMRNIALGWESPLDVVIPRQLWVLMGMSTTTMVASPAILAGKATKEPAAEAVAALQDAPEVVSKENIGLLVYNADPRDAKWGDLFRGEEVGNATTIDIGKLQMFFFTFILVLAYSAAIASIFRDVTGSITGLPPVQEGMNVLLGISQAGYLTNKTLVHSPEAQIASTPPRKRATKKAARKKSGA